MGEIAASRDMVASAVLYTPLANMGLGVLREHTSLLTYPNKTSANNYLAMYVHLTEDSAEPNLRCRHGNAEDARTALCTQRRVGLTGSLHTTSRWADRLSAHNVALR